MCENKNPKKGVAEKVNVDPVIARGKKPMRLRRQFCKVSISEIEIILNFCHDTVTTDIFELM